MTAAIDNALAALRQAIDPTDVAQRLAAIEQKMDAILAAIGQPPAPDFITATEAAEMLGYSPRYFATRIATRPSFPSPYGKKWSRPEILAWIKKQNRSKP